MNDEAIALLRRLVEAFEKGLTVKVQFDGLPATEEKSFAAVPHVDVASGHVVDAPAPASSTDPAAESDSALVAEAPKAAPVVRPVVAMRPLERVGASSDGLDEKRKAISRRLHVLKGNGIEVPEHLLREPRTVEEAAETMNALRSLSVIPVATGG